MDLGYKDNLDILAFAILRKAAYVTYMAAESSRRRGVTLTKGSLEARTGKSIKCDLEAVASVFKVDWHVIANMLYEQALAWPGEGVDDFADRCARQTLEGLKAVAAKGGQP